LFLHGGGGFSPQQPFVAPLSEKRRVVAPSHPGFGKSGLRRRGRAIDDPPHL
jgi:pimeloyl-ACP methyl ester carboxylesterase